MNSDGDLDGPVHPLFDQIATYPGILPALRLATKYLTEPMLLPFWHTLLYSTKHDLPGESAAFGAPCSVFRIEKPSLTADETRAVVAELKAIAKDVQITFDYERLHNSSWGMARRTYDVLNALGSKGTGTHINMAPSFLAFIDPNSKVTPEHRLRASFMLAVTLCHEFAHCVYHHCTEARDDEREPWVGNQSQAELGHAWQSVVHGGIHVSLGDRIDFKHGLGLTYWPLGTDVQYIENPTDPDDSTVSPVRRIGKGPKKYQTTHVYPMIMIYRQFHKQFWGNIFQIHGIQALRYQKKLGFRYRNWDWFPNQGYDEGWESDESDEFRNADEKGIVRNGQPYRESPPLPPDVPSGDEDDDNNAGPSNP